MQQNGRNVGLQDHVQVLLFQNRVALQNNFVALNRHHFSGILVHEVFAPRFQHAGRQLAVQHTLQTGLGNFDFLGQAEDLQNVLVALKTDGTEQRRHRQLLLPVDVRVHHVVDVRCKFNPAAFERNDPCRVQLRTVGVVALAKEYARRTVQLGNHHALCAVHDERAAGGHIGNSTQVNVLNDGLKVLVFGIGTIQF